jgi:hypothetical protein
MAKTRGTGLLMVWADIDPEFEAEYHRWYDEEHIAHLLAVPGFLSAGRYQALKVARNTSRSMSSKHPRSCAARPFSTACGSDPRPGGSRLPAGRSAAITC